MDRLISKIKNQVDQDQEETKKSFKNVKNDVDGMQSQEHKAKYWKGRQTAKRVQDKVSDDS